MAAKAEPKSTTSELLSLADAWTLGVEVYGSPSLVERLIEEASATGKTPWACRRIEATPETHPLAAGENRAGLFWGVPAFWRRAGRGSDPRVVLHVDWKRSWAESRGVAPHDYKMVFVVRAWAILLPRAAVETLFGLDRPPGDPVPAAKWIGDQAKEMKDAGEIPLEDFGITDFARALEARMRKAAKTDPSIRPVKSSYIKNNLRAWGLWPVSSIK
jgi:hypothetical protein